MLRSRRGTGRRWLIAIAMLAVPSTATAAPQAINFDDRPAPPTFGSAPHLTTAYQAQGVIFSGPTPDEGGEVLDEDGLFGVNSHSPPNFLAFTTNPAQSADGPETLTFSSPVSSVAVKAGHSSAGTITLQAFDGATSVATSALTGFNTLQPLAVVAPRITSARLSFSGTSMIADDVRYEVIPGTGGGTQNPVDKSKPALGGLSFSWATFKAARSGAAFGAQRRRKRSKARTGTKVSFNLSEASAVKFTVQRRTSGRRVSRKCKTRTRKNRSKSRCTLWRNVRGSFTVSGKAGKNTFRFRGRIRGKPLKPGSYRLNSQATDKARNKSPFKRKQFKIVK